MAPSMSVPGRAHCVCVHIAPQCRRGAPRRSWPDSKDTMDTTTVGIREFRASLADYIEADAPVTITRHGQAVGLFVPLRRPSAQDLQRLQAAAAKVREVLPLNEDEVDELVADFDALRRGRPRRGQGAKK